MRRRISIATVVLVVLACLTRCGGAEERDPRQPERASKLATELRLPAEAPIGHWANPEEGARWEESRRRIGVELLALPDRGPLRCKLRAVPGAAAAGKPELDVLVSNPTDGPVTLRRCTDVLDQVTFIFRGPDEKVVSSFCYATVRSPVRFEEAPPDCVLSPGEVQAAPIYLSVAADHGFRPLRPGRYSIEAVFQCASLRDRHGKEQDVVSRSDRVPVLVGQR